MGSGFCLLTAWWEPRWTSCQPLGRGSAVASLTLALVAASLLAHLWDHRLQCISPLTSHLWPQTAVHLTSDIAEGSVLPSASTQSWKAPTAVISYLSGWHRLFPGVPRLCCTRPFRLSSWHSTPVLSLWSNLQSLSLNTQPPLSMTGELTNVSDWEVLSALMSVVKSFHFFFQIPVAVLPSEVLKLTPTSAH